MYRFLFSVAVLLCSTSSARAACDPGTEVGPCLCLEYVDSKFALQCSDVVNGGQITEVLLQTEATEVESLDIINSPSLISMPADVFGETQINHIRFYSTGLQSLSAEVFSGPTQGALVSLYVKYSDLFTTIDPAMITALTSLQELYVSSTGLTQLTGSIGTSSSLEYVDLSQNSISSIDADYFAGAPSISVVLLAFNELTSTSLSSLNFVADQGDLFLDLGYNSLSEGVTGAQFTAAVPRELILSGNGITELAEESYAPLMAEMTTQYPALSPYILLDNNDLTCGCEISWIPENPQNDMLQSALCSNGQLVSNLEAEDFADC